MLFVGCHKNTAANHVPPPPTVTPAPTATVTKPAPTGGTASPKTKPVYVETGLASWYGPPYHNHKGSNGEIYNQNALTAAHRTIPLNSMVREHSTKGLRIASDKLKELADYMESATQQKKG